MFLSIKTNTNIETELYNKILLLSRNKLFYTKFSLTDTFQNRINLIFIHTSFLFIKVKTNKSENLYKALYQKVFDIVFKKIEVNMREIGYGDMTVNKNMKFLVKSFYDILHNCENYNKKNNIEKNLFLTNYLSINDTSKRADNSKLIDYFDIYRSFCVDLDPNSVLKGELNFTYK